MEISRRNVIRASLALSAVTAFGGLSACRSESSAGTANATAPGISDTEVVIGTTLPLSGSVAAFGKAYDDGMNAYFNYVNANGGINGKKVKLIVYDDAYEVPKTVQYTKQLVESDKVFATLFQLGTPTNAAINEYLNQRKVPNFPASNSRNFADPVKSPWTVVPTGPSNFANGGILATAAVEAHPGKKIGILYQNDDLGKEYTEGFKDKLGGAQVAHEVSYNTQDTSVDSQVIALQAAGVEVWFLAAATKFAVLAVQKAAALGWTPDIYAIQQATDARSMEAMGAAATDKMVTYLTIKDPRLPAFADDPALKAYAEIAAKHRPSADVTDPRVMEGMAVAKLFADKFAELKTFTQEELVKVFRATKDYDTGSYIPLFTARPTTNLLANAAQLARWDGKNFAPFGPVIEA